ncbi:hypothetical protein CONLIGDRAFT_648935 [Coniochaeta ligniaria NRRL 30616]|uniref:Uncharacterized protein n=1 Tax=Coniochaeta ligniaria NRRL 30616 TaxID=1408157 RepID=A0A1J7I909_9PEZI|nr:hypothetical protein CONLIGDRAFT_648935 [Coniochaeta ligniaria NRRL 30616]
MIPLAADTSAKLLRTCSVYRSTVAYVSQMHSSSNANEAKTVRVRSGTVAASRTPKSTTQEQASDCAARTPKSRTQEQVSGCAALQESQLVGQTYIRDLEALGEEADNPELCTTSTPLERLLHCTLGLCSPPCDISNAPLLLASRAAKIWMRRFAASGHGVFEVVQLKPDPTRYRPKLWLLADSFARIGALPKRSTTLNYS